MSQVEFEVSRSHERVFDVISGLREAGRPLTLTEIAASTGTAPSSVHSMLAALVSRQVVAVNGAKRYSLGPALLQYGASYAKRTPLYRAAWRPAVQLAHDTGMTAAIAVPWRDRHFVLAVHDEPNAAVGLSVGSLVPLDAGSYGKVYYAHSGAALPARLRRFTDATIVERSKFVAELKKVREVGYATDRGEYVDDVVAVSSAVTSADGYEGLVALSSSSGAALDLAEAGSLVGQLCARASSVLGDASREPAWGESF